MRQKFIGNPAIVKTGKPGTFPVQASPGFTAKAVWSGGICVFPWLKPGVKHAELSYFISEF
jgi:hypothetical protein